MDDISKIVSLAANIFTILASSIAIYLFTMKRKPISMVFRLLVNYSSQVTLSELKGKLERLNDLRATDPEQLDEIINIFHEITGQIKGNSSLSVHFETLVSEINELVVVKEKLTEPRKRALVSELRERLRNINISNIDDLLGEPSE